MWCDCVLCTGVPALCGVTVLCTGVLAQCGVTVLCTGVPAQCGVTAFYVQVYQHSVV